LFVVANAAAAVKVAVVSNDVEAVLVALGNDELGLETRLDPCNGAMYLTALADGYGRKRSDAPTSLLDRDELEQIIDDVNNCGDLSSTLDRTRMITFST
jgi:hypothetical protein